VITSPAWERIVSPAHLEDIAKRLSAGDAGDYRDYPVRFAVSDGVHELTKMLPVYSSSLISTVAVVRHDYGPRLQHTKWTTVCAVFNPWAANRDVGTLGGKRNGSIGDGLKESRLIP